MKSGFKTVRLGHAAGLHQRNNQLNKRDACLTGGLYKTPSQGQSVDVSQPVNVSWDTSCLNTTAVDILLYAPSANIPLMHKWETVNYQTGSYNATLKSGWWNSTSSISLEFIIVPSGAPAFTATGAAGPLFIATSSGTSTDDTAVAGAVEQVNNFPTKKHGPSKGGVAAAVIIPLLVIIGLVTVAYIRVKRQRGKEKRKRFSEMVDKRMSTISTDWKSLSGAGANAAIRNSMAIPGNRASSFSFGGIRPASTVALEGGQAGIGARGILAQDGPDAPYMSQLRPGIRTSAFENRVSRVSFAADPRPSTDSRRSRQSRAFHTSSVVVPPLPERQFSTESSSNSSPMLSPKQTAGPLSLTHEDIQARMAGEDSDSRYNSNYDDFMPALTMMRLGEQGDAAAEIPSVPQMPTPPSPTHQVSQVSQSPLGAMPMQPMHANVMSPDAMLRAYAERRAMGVPSGPAPPTPAASYNNMGMRVLYSPNTSAPATSTTYPVQPSNLRKSLAPTMYDNDDAYVGTAE